MNTIKKNKLNLNRETLVTLDPKALADVNGGAGSIFSNYMPCISNNTGGNSCLSYCPVNSGAPNCGGGGGGATK